MDFKLRKMGRLPSLPPLKWNWMWREPRPPKRRESAPPIPYENYDRDANRPEYKQAFNEYLQRGPRYNQMTVKEESEENGSQSTNTATDQGEASGVQQQPEQPMPGTTKQHSLPNQTTRSMTGGPSKRRTNTPNSSAAVNENNNSIYVNEIAEFEGNCVNDSSFGAATNQSPPKTFYRNNANPFSPNAELPVSTQAGPSTSSAVVVAVAQQTVTKLEQSRQRARVNLMNRIELNAKTASSSDSSGAYRKYDVDSISSVGEEEGAAKPSNGQKITAEVHQEMVNVLQVVAQCHRAPEQLHTQNSPVGQAIESNLSGVCPMSAVTSFRRCEGVVDENFAFLNDTEWGNCAMDEIALSDPVNRRDVSTVTDLDEPAEALNGHDVNNPETSADVDAIEQRSQQNIDTTNSPQAIKHPFYVIECKAKDIQPKASTLRNSILTPFQLSAGSFRKTTVTLKKGCPRDAPSQRVVEEAIERDFEILSKVKHSNIVILMAACFNRKLINHMTLLMEPMDYTLNFYMHHLKKSFAITECITIVHQIASAALYLQECGYIHSNISSHNILYRERPYCVKLSSFELATHIDPTPIREELDQLYPELMTSPFGYCDPVKQQIGRSPNGDDLKQQYSARSKHSTGSPANEEIDFMDIPSKYLVYDITYRRRLSLHNLTPPELLSMDLRFVFPSPLTDVYSLCLLLWELLNRLVPFVIYNQLDVERIMIGKKFNLPFFERERCYLFMEIFRVGLQIDPEHRDIDLHQLIEQLDSIELELFTGGFHVPPQSIHPNAEGSKNGECQNHSQHSENCKHAAVPSLVNNNPVQSNDNPVNSFVSSPNAVGFHKTLTLRERTSTMKLRKKPQRALIGELFPAVDETTAGAASNDKKPSSSSFVNLNATFKEMCDHVHRHVTADIDEDEKLNKNLAEIAEDLCRNISDEPEDKSLEDRPASVQSKSSTPSSSAERNRNARPTVVGYSVKRLNNSKTQANLLETPFSVVPKKLFAVSPNEDEMPSPMPTTPIARQNYIRRNAWLSERNPPETSRNETDRMTNGSDWRAGSSEVNKRLNVSVRIVHNKTTPEKPITVTQVEPPKQVDEVRPSVLSKIQFFNSTSGAIKSETPMSNGKRSTPLRSTDEVVSASQSSKTAVPLLNGKCATASVKADQVLSPSYASKSGVPMSNGKHTAAPAKAVEVVSNNKSTNGRAAATVANESTVKEVVQSTNERSAIINELTHAVHNLQKTSVDQPQTKQLFENKLWKRELDICNRSLNSSDGSNGTRIVAPEYRSVRDTILKFEKVTRNQSASNASAELLKSSPKPHGPGQSNPGQQSDSSTLFTRTVYSERILSGIELSPLDNQPMFEQLNLGTQKMETVVSLRQVRQTSSDVAVTNRRKTDVRQTICGSEVELLTLNSSVMVPSTSSAAAKYVCYNCASSMSSNELKALTYEPVNTSIDGNVNLLEETLTKRCQARVKSQDTRSIEDLYIDDDYLHELGANMELQSNCSDLLDFDLISSGLFNSNCDADPNRR